MAKNKKDNNEQSLRFIDDSVDAISNISIYLTIASSLVYRTGNCNSINSLRNKVKLKAPTIYNAFNHYLLAHCKVIVNSVTGCLDYDNGKTALKCPVSFIGWLRKNEEAHKLFSNIDYELLEKVAVSQSKVARTSCTPNNPRASSNIIQYRSERCPCCGKKFQIGSADMIESHSCNTITAAQSIRTISGGGGPGTGKKR